MKRSIWFILIIGLMLSSCVVLSFHPLYSPDTITFRPEMVGTWKIDDDETFGRQLVTKTVSEKNSKQAQGTTI